MRGLGRETVTVLAAAGIVASPGAQAQEGPEAEHETWRSRGDGRTTLP